MKICEAKRFPPGACSSRGRPGRSAAGEPRADHEFRVRPMRTIDPRGPALGTTPRAAGDQVLSAQVIVKLPELLLSRQQTFAETGGCHGAALFDPEGGLMLAREDVGRHNAVDKLVGAALLQGFPGGQNPWAERPGQLRACAKGRGGGHGGGGCRRAPSSLAVNIANATGITLVGFNRGKRFNVYAHATGCDLSSDSPMVVTRIFLSPEHVYVGHFGKPAGTAQMVEVDRVEAVTGRGLVGDRYFNRPEGHKAR